MPLGLLIDALLLSLPLGSQTVFMKGYQSGYIKGPTHYSNIPI